MFNNINMPVIKTVLIKADVDIHSVLFQSRILSIIFVALFLLELLALSYILWF